MTNKPMLNFRVFWVNTQTGKKGHTDVFASNRDEAEKIISSKGLAVMLIVS